MFPYLLFLFFSLSSSLIPFGCDPCQCLGYVYHHDSPSGNDVCARRLTHNQCDYLNATTRGSRKGEITGEPLPICYNYFGGPVTTRCNWPFRAEGDVEYAKCFAYDIKSDCTPCIWRTTIFDSVAMEFNGNVNKICPVGSFYNSSGYCNLCPGGTFGNSGSPNLETGLNPDKNLYSLVTNNLTALTTNACSGPCTAGYFCPTGSTSANDSPCPPGNYCPSGSANFIPCPVGSYCEAISASPTLCPGGTFGASPSLQTSVCSGNCLRGYYCPAGSRNSTSVVCPLGSYCPASSGTPTPCPAGFFGATTGLQDIFCSGRCPLGKFCPSNTTFPIECSAGSFANVTGLSSCFLCRAGTYSGANSSFCNVCSSTAGSYCGVGSTSAIGLKCTPGKFSSSAGATVCSFCVNGTYSVYPGASACTNCDVTSSNDLLLPRSSLVSTASGNLVMIAGGASTDQVDVYNTTDATWFVSKLSNRRNFLASASLNFKMFFAGGSFGLVRFATVDIFDTISNSWTVFMDGLSESRSLLASFTVNDCAYFGGGYGITFSKTVDIYNLSTNSFRNFVHGLSISRSELSAASSGSVGIFAGGFSEVELNSVDIFYGDNFVWSTSLLSIGRKNLAGTSAGNFVFFGGGTLFNGTVTNFVDIYDRLYNSWSLSFLSTSRTWLSAVSNGCKVLFSGGWTVEGVVATIDIYDLSTKLWVVKYLDSPACKVTSIAINELIIIAGGEGPDGYAQTVNYINFCPPGFYNLNRNCIRNLCDAGKYSNGSSCVNCLPGYYGDLMGQNNPTCSGSCIASAGYYCGTGATLSYGIPCPPGTFNSEIGSTSIGSCQPNCSSLPGYRCNYGEKNSTGSICPIGYYSNVGGVTSANCTGPCKSGAGYFCDIGATSANGTPCYMGKYSIAIDATTVSTCRNCPQDSYTIYAGSSSCTPFLPGLNFSTLSILSLVSNLVYTSLFNGELSLGRMHLFAASIRDIAIFAGGSSNITTCFTLVDIFNITSGAWTTSELSLARTYAVAVSIGEMILIAGGYTLDGSFPYLVESIDYSLNSKLINGLVLGRANLAGCAILNLFAFFAGGFSNKSIDVVDVFNVTSNSFSNPSKLSLAREFLTGSSTKSIAIFAGGSTNNVETNRVDIFDLYSNLWTTSQLSEARQFLSSTSVGSLVLFAGGSSFSNLSSVVDIYDSVLLVWSSTFLSKSRKFVSTTSLGPRAFFVGGETSSGVTDVVEIYDVKTSVWTRIDRGIATATKFGVMLSLLDTAMFAGGEFSLKTVNFFTFCASGFNIVGGKCSARCVALPGSYCGSGFNSSVLCPTGYYGSEANLIESTCTGDCTSAPGYYCASGATSRSGFDCPVGRFGNISGLTTSECSGACVAIKGSYCSSSQTQSSGSLCPPGKYGDTDGLTTINCSGNCSAIAGYSCIAGSVSSKGEICKISTYSLEGSTSCSGCGLGFYGNTTGLTSTECSGICFATKGYFCAAYATASIGFPCPPGTYNPFVGVTSSKLCFKNCSSPIGSFCGFGESNHGGSMCPVGRYGSSLNVTTSLCSGSCVSGPGFYCGLGATSYHGFACPSGKYNSESNATSIEKCINCAYGSYSKFGGSSSCSTYMPVSSLSKLNSFGLSKPRSGLISLVVGSLIFFIGGKSSQSLNTVDIFNVDNGFWITSTISVARWGHVGSYFQNKIVVGGGFLDALGFFSCSIVDVFDTITFTGITFPNGLSAARGLFASLYDPIFNVIIFAGGAYSAVKTTGPNLKYNVIDIFNISSNVFYQSSFHLSIARSSLSACSSESISLFAGGIGNRNEYLKIVDIFSYSKWTTSSLSSPRSDFACTDFGSKIVFAGGYDGFDSNIVDIYDTITLDWTIIVLPLARSRLSVTSVGSKILVSGGIHNSVASNRIDIFDFAVSTWSSLNFGLVIPLYDLVSVSTGDMAIIAGGSDGSVGSNYVTYISFCPPGSILTSTSCVCDRGKFNNGTSCLPCPAGRYGDKFGLTERTCSGLCVITTLGYFCGSGETSPFGSACPLGFFGNSSFLTGSQCSGVCSAPEGYYCYFGATSEFGRPCPPGKYGNLAGSTSAACTADCISIPGRYCGFAETSGNGRECPPGKYSDISNATSCDFCSAGYFSISSGSKDCLICPAGKFSGTGANTCVSCDAGSFSSKNGSLSCIKCLPGTFAKSIGSIGCINCDKGTFQHISGSSTCVSCDAGKFSSDGWTSCFSCSLGFFSNYSGATICEACSAGDYQNFGGKISCEATLPGFYQDESGQSYSKKCPKGFYSPSFRMTTCRSCLPGFYNFEDASEKCTPCVVGTFTKTNSSVNCYSCSKGKYSPINGSTECFECSPGTFASDMGVSTCLECVSGTYSENFGSTSCTACNSGTFSYKGSSKCLVCPSGTFSDVGESLCRNCADGETSIVGSRLCYSCISGKYSQSGFSSCSDCNAGSFSNSGASVCSVCSPGSFSLNSSSTCTPCMAGTFGNIQGLTTCDACLSPYYSFLGATSCELCPEGSFVTHSTSALLGAVSCTICPAGKFSTLNRDICVSCPVGSYSASSSADCLECSVGFTSNYDHTSCIDSFVISSHLSYSIYGLSIFCFTITVAVFCLVYYFRQEKIIVAASPNFLFAILVGMILVYIATCLFSTTQSKLICHTKYWFLIFGSNLIYVSIFGKSWRLDQIFNPSQLNMKAYTDFSMFLRCLPIYLFDLIVLLWHSIMYPSSLASVDVYQCVLPQMNLFYCLICIPKLILLLYCLQLSWSLRNIDDWFNESKFIFASFWQLAIALIVTVMSYFLFGDSIRETNFVVGVCFGLIFVTFSTLLFLFIPKIYIVIYLKDTTDFRVSKGFGGIVSKKKPVHEENIDRSRMSVSQSNLRRKGKSNEPNNLEELRHLIETKYELLVTFQQEIIKYKHMILVLRDKSVIEKPSLKLNFKLDLKDKKSNSPVLSSLPNHVSLYANPMYSKSAPVTPAANHRKVVSKILIDTEMLGFNLDDLGKLGSVIENASANISKSEPLTPITKSIHSKSTEFSNQIPISLQHYSHDQVRKSSKILIDLGKLSGSLSCHSRAKSCNKVDFSSSDCPQNGDNSFIPSELKHGKDD